MKEDKQEMTISHKKTAQYILSTMMGEYGHAVCPISTWENEGGYYEAGNPQTAHEQKRRSQ